MSSMGSVQFRLGLLLTLVVVASISTTVLMWRDTAQVEQATLQIQHTEDVLGRLAAILQLVTDAETATRGYVITGRDAYLGPYWGARAGLAQEIEQVAALTVDHAAQRSRLAEVRRLVDSQMALRARIVEAVQRDGPSAAANLVRSDEGRATMDALRAATAAMVGEQERLLATRQADSARATRRAQFTLGVVSALTALIVVGAYGLVRQHLSARTRAEAALRQSAAEVQDLYDWAPCGYHSLDDQGRFVAINQTELDWLGYSREEVVGRMRFTDLLTDASRPVFDEQFPRFKASGWIANLEFELVCKDGRVLPVQLNATAITDADGRYVASRSTLFDITQRRRAEQAIREANESLERRVREQTGELRAAIQELEARAEAHRRTHEALRDSETRYRRLAQATFEGVVLSTGEGRLLDVNDAFCRLFGYTRDEALQTGGLQFVAPSCREAIGARLRRLDEGLFETIGQRKDGTTFPMEGQTRNLTIDGQAVRMTAARDVTEHKRSEDALRQSEEAVRRLNAELERRVDERTRQLEEANGELEAFSYSVSHDLRAPLRHVQGYVDMLARETAGTLSEKGQRYLETISEASRDMGALIDDLLAFSRMGRVDLRQHSVDLERVVRECLAGLEPALARRRVKWTVGALPPVIGDRAMIKLAMANLLDNAVKYTRPRDVAEIEIGCDGVEDGQCTLFVRDNGVGFDPAYGHKLFGVFQRLHRADEFEGTGIGLANIRRIVLRHGGRTWAEGALDAGATFYFTLTTAATHSRDTESHALRTETHPAG